jgi:hypothetical protein
VSSPSPQVPGVQHLITCVSMSGLGNMKGACMDGLKVIGCLRGMLLRLESH